MSASDAQDGIFDAEVVALETLWRSTAVAPQEPFMARCIAQTQAELAADRQRRATMRFHLTAAAVLLIGWHASLVATWSATTHAPSGEATTVAAHLDDRRTLLAELTAELALETSGETSAASSLPRASHAAKARH